MPSGRAFGSTGSMTFMLSHNTASSVAQERILPGAFLCNRDEVSYSTKKDRCLYAAHTSPALSHSHSHTLCNLSYMLQKLLSESTLASSPANICYYYSYWPFHKWYLYRIRFRVLQSFACSRHQLIKFELLTQSITWISPPSAAAPPVRMGLTNHLVGKYLHENHFCFMY